MRLYVITPIYARTTEGVGATPLVHYFAREWMKMGHEVTVFNFMAKYPRPYYWFGKMFQHRLNSRLGMLVPIECPDDYDYVAEGVRVIGRALTKRKPHTEFNARNVRRAIDVIDEVVEGDGVPDWFVGHWDSPNVAILPVLKERYRRPVAIVFHNNVFNLEKRYGGGVVDRLRGMDVVGYRSEVARADFERKYFVPERSFICHSGVSDLFLKAGEGVRKDFRGKVNRFVYTGSMISRKHASCLYEALCHAYPKGDFAVKFIGDGTETERIRRSYVERKLGTVEFTGRIPRDAVVGHLKQADVFAMISEGEIFGLVYLEAMALGLITIGSRNEGIDGIIIDGKNGFLCEAGNTVELASIIEKIKNMDKSELQRLSNEARKTAVEFSDYNVAKNYLSNLIQKQ